MKKNQICIVRDCDSTEIKNPDLKFYPIPKDENIKKKWLKAINRSDDELNKRCKVCSKHFKNTDYTVTRFNYTVGNKNDAGTDKSVCEWKVLKADVVPSLNLPEKSTFKIKISKKDNSRDLKVEEVKVKEEKDKEKPARMPKRPAPPIADSPRETPSRSRRQASKEALKQLQLLLDDENDPVEILSDDDIIPVEPTPPPPPRKKYKLSHKKSTEADHDVLVLKSITNRNAENTLELDCWVEPLEEVQKNRIKKIQEEEKEIQSKLDALISQGNAKVVHKGDLSTIIEISEYVQSAIQAAQTPPTPTPVVLNNAIGAKQGYQLVMDPRLGFIVGTVNPSESSNSITVSPSPKVYQGKVQVAQNLHQTPTTSTNNTRMRTRRGAVIGRTSPQPSPTSSHAIGTPPITTRSGLQTRSAPAKNTPPTPSPKSVPATKTVTPTRTVPTRMQIATRNNSLPNKNTPAAKNAPPPAKKTVPVATPPPPTTRTRQASSTSLTNTRPSEDNVEGGLATGGGAGGGQARKIVVDLTSEDGKSAADSKEIAFNKLQGKTYPSLVVVARPHLRVEDMACDRPKLDSKVKSVLMHAPTKFTEWLIQQGLVRSEQKCSTHINTQLKLGMYSDVSKFPYSGGYVWISDCCPHRFVSVFSGSLFEGSVHPPMVILKLLYHWACQTNIQNVTQWVKVDNLYVKGMYTWLRAVTTTALHTHLIQLGGSGKRVEVGVISLGTTSQDGNQRQVKVEVLGVLETSSKLIRLRAVEPQSETDKNYKKRFSKILEPIQQWVHPESVIVADLTVDKQTLHNMGFKTVVQSLNTEYGNNRQIMEYLRRIVPRMFQNTLSLLSRQIIQQFLDELVWREWFGTTTLQAFDNLVLHLAEQTRFDSQPLITRLNRVAQNPFKNWALPSTVKNATTTIPLKPTENATPQPNQKKNRNKKELNTKPVQQPAPMEVNRPPKSISPDVPEQMVPLENYYYGTIDNYTKTPTITLNMKCPFCKSVFDNNILLMNHLFKHAHNVSQDAQLCRYCLTSVPTASDLLKHIASSHPAETKFDNGFVCLICETQYMNPFILGKHMSKEHCPSELPYQCGTCGYRCSNHKQAIDHFYKTHDNGPTIQCPFCLKSTTVYTTSRNIHQNMNYFIQHLQKHQRKQFARRCGKCNLWFVQKDVLRDHQTRMHVSQRGKPGLVPWNAPRNGVMVPKSNMDKYPGDADVINFTTLTLNVPKNLMCKECKTPMDTPKHFPSFESCQNPNCQYSTCCTNAMQEHNAKCIKTPNIIEKENLPFEMFCICGYSDTDGNQMARHLAICERKSAYPSKVEAKAAIVTHSMLDVLGLVRKPDETKKDESDSIVALSDDKEQEIVMVSDKNDTTVMETDTLGEKKDEDITDVEKAPNENDVSKTENDTPAEAANSSEKSENKDNDEIMEVTTESSTMEVMEITEDIGTDKNTGDSETITNEEKKENEGNGESERNENEEKTSSEIMGVAKESTSEEIKDDVKNTDEVENDIEDETKDNTEENVENEKVTENEEKTPTNEVNVENDIATEKEMETSTNKEEIFGNEETTEEKQNDNDEFSKPEETIEDGENKLDSAEKEPIEDTSNFNENSENLRIANEESVIVEQKESLSENETQQSTVHVDTKEIEDGNSENVLVDEDSNKLGDNFDEKGDAESIEDSKVDEDDYSEKTDDKSKPSKQSDESIESTFKYLEDRAIEDHSQFSNDKSEEENTIMEDFSESNSRADSEVSAKTSRLENNTEQIMNHLDFEDDSQMDTEDIPVEDASQKDIQGDEQQFVSNITDENNSKCESDVSNCKENECRDVFESTSVSESITKSETEVIESEEATPMETD